jgi:hypothetical protein
MIELDVDISKYEILRYKGEKSRCAYIMLSCDNCGKLHKVKVMRKKAVVAKRNLCFYCANHSKEHSESSVKSNLGRVVSRETREKISKSCKGKKIRQEVLYKWHLANKGRRATEEQRKAASERMKGVDISKFIEVARIANIGRKHTDDWKDRQSQLISESWKDPIIRERRLKAHSLAVKTPSFIEKNRQNMINYWANLSQEDKDTYIKRIVTKANAKPNTIELKLQSIINKVCPNQYEYTGDGKVIINGVCPDFTNINGQKKAIELFGDYFHNPNKYKGKLSWHRTEEGRVQILAEYGYKCLVLWEKEVRKDEDVVVQKLLAFNNS